MLPTPIEKVDSSQLISQLTSLLNSCNLRRMWRGLLFLAVVQILVQILVQGMLLAPKNAWAQPEQRFEDPSIFIFITTKGNLNGGNDLPFLAELKNIFPAAVKLWNTANLLPSKDLTIRVSLVHTVDGSLVQSGDLSDAIHSYQALAEYQVPYSITLQTPFQNDKGKFLSAFFHELTHILHYEKNRESPGFLREIVALGIEEGLSVNDSPNQHREYTAVFKSEREPGFLESPKPSTLASQYSNWRLFAKFWLQECGIVTGLEVLAQAKTIHEIKISSGQTSEHHAPSFCIEFKTLFLEFQTRKYGNTWEKSLFPNQPNMPFFTERPKPAEVSPYSSRGYYADQAGRCHPEDIRLDSTRCLFTPMGSR